MNTNHPLLQKSLELAALPPPDNVGGPPPPARTTWRP